MMKVRAGELVILGLSDRNLELLREGKPILFDGSEVRLPGVKIAIMHGKTERDMEQGLIKNGFIIPQ